MSSVKFFPSFGLSAQRNKLAGAWRLWLAARSLANGNDGTSIEGLEELCTKAVSSRTFARWLKQANEIGLLKTVTNGTRVMITSEKKATLILGVRQVESHRVEIKIKHILGKDWKSYLWAAREACITSGPISRVKLQQITGKDRGRQRKAEKIVGTKYTKNIARTSYTGDMVDGLKEYTGQPYFKMLDKSTGQWIACRRLPDVRHCDEVQIVGCGRSRNINTALTKSAIIYNNSGQSLSMQRIFCESPEQTKETLRRARRELDRQNPHEIYSRIHKNTSTNGKMWEQTVL